MITPAKARLIVDYGRITNSPVSQDIIDLSQTDTVDSRELGPFSNTIVGHSRDALQHCLDNHTQCVLLNPNTYDALSVALCDAYLSDREGRVVIITNGSIKKTAKVIERYGMGKVYIEELSLYTLDESDFIITTLHDFFNNKSYQENVKMVISINETNSFHSSSVASSAIALSEYDRVIFIEHVVAKMKFEEYDIFSSLMSSSYVISHLIRCAATIPNNFDKTAVEWYMYDIENNFPVIDMCRLFGIFYPRVKPIGFCTDLSVQDSSEKEHLLQAEKFINSTVEVRQSIINDCMLDNSYLNEKKVTITHIYDNLRTSSRSSGSVIFRTSNEKLAAVLGPSLSIPVIDGCGDERERTKISRFLYPSPSHKAYAPIKRNIYPTKTIFYSADILDNEDILNKCTTMIYCEPFADRESFLLEYEMCRLYNITMIFILVSGTYEEYLPAAGWFN